jgi:hypothetical protein
MTFEELLDQAITLLHTVRLDARTQAIVRAEALAAHTSVGALVRQWIEERLELQSRREAAR